MANYLIKSGDTLGQIAQANQTDIATLQKLNPQITNPNLIIAGQNLNLPTAPIAPAIPAVQPASTPTIQSIQSGLNNLLKGFGGTLNPQTGQIDITAEQLTAATQPKPIDVTPLLSTLGTSTSAMVAGVQERLKAEEALKTPEQKAGEDKVSKMIADIETKYAEFEGKPAYAAEQYQLAGATPEAKAAITSIKSKIAAKTAEFNAIEADYMRAVQATERVPGTTTGIVAGQQRELARDLAYQRTAQAAQIGILQAEQLALTGEYNDAIEVANNAIELKYGSIKENIELRLQQISLIKGELNAKDKKITDAMESYLNEKKDLINQQQATETANNNAILSIMKDYPDAGWTEIPKTVAEATAKVQNSAKYKKEISATEKPATQAQETVAGYASRIEQSNPIIGSLEDEIVKMNFAKFKLEQSLPSALQSDTVRQFNQAALNFINAKLRQESGAVIGDPEYVKAEAQYLPQPGDDAITLKNKSQNRQLIFNSLKNAGGSAYTPLSELVKEPELLNTGQNLPSTNITEEQLKSAGATPVESYSGGIIENILSGKFFNFLK